MKLLILDTSYLIYRSYFAYPMLTSNGQNTGALFGFIKTVISLIREFEPDNLVFACDLPEKTWRHEILDSYKAGRPEIETQMREQFPYILEWCNTITPNVLSKSGFEADDIIFTVCANHLRQSQDSELKNNNDTENLFSSNDSVLSDNKYQECYIFSSDKDLYQMLTLPNIRFVLHHKGVTSLFGLQEFEQKYQLHPWQWVDFKALVGDNSDNLKGVSGVGPKTAIKILQEVGSLQLLFQILNIPSQIRVQDNLSEAEIVKAKAFVNDSRNIKVIDKIKADQVVVEQTYFLATLQKVPSTTIKPEPFDLTKGLSLIESFNFTSLVRSINPDYKKNLTQTSDDNALF